jgi:hypothetical protein
LSETAQKRRRTEVSAASDWQRWARFPPKKSCCFASRVPPATARTDPSEDLDPSDPLLKKQIKASITAAIVKEVVGSNRNEIAQKVEDVYERLLIGAVVFAHIPSLTAGLVKREVMASNRGV